MQKDKLLQHELHVLVPGVCGPVSDLQLLEKSDVVKHWLNTLAVTQAEECSVNVNNVIAELTGLKYSGDFPAGVLTSIANHINDKSIYYMLADPVHLQADMDHAILSAGEELAITQHESEALLFSLNKHFEQDGLCFLHINNNCWLLSSKNKINISTTDLADSIGRNVNFILPEGDDALYWKKLLTEMQMLMHGHEINEHREAKGQLTINSVWFHGCGELIDFDKTQPYSFCSDQDSLKGLAEYMDGLFNQRPTTIDAYLNSLTTMENNLTPYKNILYISDLESLVNYTDVKPWLEQLNITLEDWLYPLITYSKANNIKLFIHPCASKKYNFSRYDSFKFWKKLFNSKLTQHIADYGTIKQ